LPLLERSEENREAFGAFEIPTALVTTGSMIRVATMRMKEMSVWVTPRLEEEVLFDRGCTAAAIVNGPIAVILKGENELQV
jgi:hypothetical protein